MKRLLVKGGTRVKNLLYLSADIRALQAQHQETVPAGQAQAPPEKNHTRDEKTQQHRGNHHHQCYGRERNQQVRKAKLSLLHWREDDRDCHGQEHVQRKQKQAARFAVAEIWKRLKLAPERLALGRVPPFGEPQGGSGRPGYLVQSMVIVAFLGSSE